MKYISVILGMVFLIGCSSSYQYTKIPDIIHKKDNSFLNALDKSDNSDIKYYFAKTKNKKYDIKSLFSTKWSYVNIKKGRKVYKFAIMKSSVPISQKDNTPMTNVNYDDINKICMDKYNGILVSAYVFDEARRKQLIYRPKGVEGEIIAPVDEEEDAVFISPKDNIITPEGMILKFDWKAQKYSTIGNMYISNNTAFRCMRVK